MANNVSVNYDDERFGKVESDKNQAMTELNNTYQGMIGESDNYYKAQIDASKQWADKQTELQKQQTDFAIEQIEQQKDQAHKDYLKEQSGAYVDWQKQSNQYGVESEKQAAAGMTGTGFSESSQVAMYTAYQNRVATARESYSRAVLNYDNAIKDARLQGSAKMAEIAYQQLQAELELSLQGFQYKNQLLLDLSSKKLEVEQLYHNRWQDVLAQINHENSMAEQIRQYNEKMAEEKRQFDAQMALEREQFEYTKAKSSGGGGSGSSGGSKAQVNQQKTAPVKSSTSNNSSGKTSIDWYSVAKTGVGPRTLESLAELTSEGKITYRKVGDKLVFSRNTSLGAAQGLLDKHTMMKK